MRHKSVPLLDHPCEFINIVPINPLISKCQIKVCYVGDDPNRNRSVITKDVARKMANSLPGSPIVGFYNVATQDFEEHNRTIKVANGKFEWEDATRPYGFVDIGAKCWFQWYLDDDQVKREYLVTEGYIWTGQYQEAQRIIDQGNNQSMELDEKTLDASWTKDSNGKPKFFIINEAIISKLCILGEDSEPCFEGSNITPVQFSFDDSFKNELKSMMQELKECLLNKGGSKVFTRYSVEIGDSLWNALYSFIQERNYANIEAVLVDGERNFAVIKDENKNVYSLDFSVTEEGAIQLAEEVVAFEDYTPEEEPQFALADVEAFEVEFKKAKEDEKEKEEDKEDKSDASENDSNSEGEKTPEEKEEPASDSEEEDKEEDDDKKKDKKDKYSVQETKIPLEEEPEFIALNSKYSDLETRYNALVAENEQLKADMESLVEFKKAAERKEKQEMIDSFYMLSEEDKKDVVDKIDSYSLNDIEAQLSIICVRNRVSFNLDDNKSNVPNIYNVNGASLEDTSTPAWVKAALDVAKTLN